MINRIDTRYFNLKEVKEGIYAAIAKPGTGAFSNAGFVDLGEEILIFDTFSTPGAGMALRETAETLTGKAIKYVLNSHYHGDHTFGNQAFSDIPIISTELTREWHSEKNKIIDHVKEKEEMLAYLAELQNQIDEETDPVNIMSLKHQYAEMACVTESIMDLILTLPDLIFKNVLTIHGSARTAEFHCLGGSHTPSDAILYLPNDQVAFMGDLLCIDMHPPIYDPYQWTANLDDILNLDIEVYIPGHGNVSSKSELIVLKNYLYYLIDLAESAVKEGIVMEEFIKTRVKTEYANWRAVGGTKRNLKTAFEKAAEKLLMAP